VPNATDLRRLHYATPEGTPSAGILRTIASITNLRKLKLGLGEGDVNQFDDLVQLKQLEEFELACDDLSTSSVSGSDLIRALCQLMELWVVKVDWCDNWGQHHEELVGLIVALPKLHWFGQLYFMNQAPFWSKLPVYGRRISPWNTKRLPDVLTGLQVVG
jgi:hypothetical protein